ncbi:MAG TPA: MBL fold metallo-hydrolase [Patescibacteria group bacterium]|nr:MBL fold metallo-hydrolase [Patescibacteria group bacterium]
MKITKFVHSCLVVETENKTVIFDPGLMSNEALDINNISSLNNIFITHIHSDHLHIPLIKKLTDKFPNISIVSTDEVVKKLALENIKAKSTPTEDVEFFEAPHENVSPLINVQPEQRGLHYLNILTNPGDSHTFSESKKILALPITAPWGSAVSALNLAIKLKPRHIIPIHDWHWREEARIQTYDKFEKILSQYDITFHKPTTGETIEITED